VSITRLDARHAWEMELLVPGLATACARHQQSANSSQAHTKPPDPVRTWGNRLRALAPAVSGLVAIPRAAVFTMLEHQRDTVLSTVRSNYAASCAGCGAPNLAISFVFVYVH